MLWKYELRLRVTACPYCNLVWVAHRVVGCFRLQELSMVVVVVVVVSLFVLFVLNVREGRVQHGH